MDKFNLKLKVWLFSKMNKTRSTKIIKRVNNACNSIIGSFLFTILILAFLNFSDGISYSIPLENEKQKHLTLKNETNLLEKMNNHGKNNNIYKINLNLYDPPNNHETKLFIRTLQYSAKATT